MPVDLLNIKAITVDCVGLHTGTRMSYRHMAGLRSTMQLQSHIEDELRALVLSLYAYVAGVPKEHLKIQRRWPKTWRDAFKERWFPAWWLRRWPVEYDKINIDRVVSWSVCPHIEGPKGRSHVFWLRDQGDIPVKEISDD